MFAFFLFTTLVYTVHAYDNGPVNIQSVHENIVGGQLVKIEDYPYQVSIFDSDGYWCGGSILTTYHVLSAGHCVILGYPPLIVHAGSSAYSNGGSIHHVEFNVTYQGTINYDVVVLRIKEPFVFDETRKPIELVAAGDEPKPGTLAVVTGWTNSTYMQTYSVQLYAVQIPIIDREVCNKIYEGTEIGPIIEGQICAGYLEGGKDACLGDSGNPLVINGKQVGIASMPIGCGRPNTLSIYADISYFHEWIMKQISN